ncbi:ABC transporter ATP-binding protein [Corynebacterium sp. H113]|uniref:ABC transporter ATP-binding protein n=1 Tax=Corynebacterium sp. H113 TaxID=3133419 RepID=UPI0030AC4329
MKWRDLISRDLLNPEFTADARTTDVAEDRFPVATARETLAYLVQRLRGRRLSVLLAVIVLIAAAWFGVAIPKLLGQIVDVVADGGTTSDIVGDLLIRMLAAAIGAGVFGALGFRMSARLAEDLIAELREDMVSTTLRLPVARVERAGAGDVVSRATDDVDRISDAVTQVLPVASSALFTVLVSIVGVGSVHPVFMLAFVATIPVHIAAVRRYLRTAPPVYAAERAAMAERARYVLSTIHGMPAVRAFGLTTIRRQEISQWSWQTVRHGVDARITHNIVMGRMHFAELVGLGTTLLLGFYLVREGMSTVGGATAAMLLFMRLFGPLTRMVMMLDIAQSGLTSLTRIVGVVRERPAPHGEVTPDRSEGVVLRNVSFSYVEEAQPTRSDQTENHAVTTHNAVDDVSLEIPVGATVALVGSSGAGKSTLAAIVAGLRLADSGEVRVAGCDMNTQAEAARGTAVALVTQEVHVFEGPLRDDLTLAAPGTSDAQIIDALHSVGANWFEHLPDGLESVVGRGGHQLNAVAAQQVALARVLLANPPVLVLDEATAEASSAASSVLGDAVATVIRNRTALVVAHQLDQAAAADAVAVMEHGRVVEFGSHEELLADGRRYAQLWESWITGREA